MGADFNNALRWEIKRKTIGAYARIAGSYVKRRPWIEVGGLGLEGRTLLDLGCGTGQYSVQAIAQGLFKEAVGVDLVVEMLRMAIKRAARGGVSDMFHPIQCDMEFLPLRGESIDSTLMIASLHSVPGRSSRLRVLTNVYNVLKPGGQLVVVVWNALKPTLFLRSIRYMLRGLKRSGLLEVGDLWVEGPAGKRYYHPFRRGEASKLLESAGFKIIRCEGLRVNPGILPDNWLLIGEKVNARGEGKG